MCTLAIYFQTIPETPLLVAANRDEFLDRAAVDPRPIAAAPWVVAGQDLAAGGTWFGLNQHGMVVGVLNRRSAGSPDPSRRSRGLLCLEILQTNSVDNAVRQVRREDPENYNGFNLLIADAEQAYVASTARDRLELTALPPGLHLITNLALNDPTCPRIAKSHNLFAALELPTGERDVPLMLGCLRSILSDHETALDPRTTEIDTLCVHRGPYGTRSSAVVAHLMFGGLRYWHAPGPPCVTEYRPVELPQVDVVT